MDKGKELLKVLTKNGCEAYIIGEASRCEILGIDTSEVEIVTSATPGMIKGIFANFKIDEIDDVACRITYEGMTFLICTFRSGREKNEKRRQAKEVYSKNLNDELSNRLMTCDAVAMTAGAKFSDAYNGFKDIKKKRIKPIGNVKNRLKQQPELCFKVIKVFSQTGFKLDGKFVSAIKAASKNFINMEPKSYIENLSLILEGKYFKKTCELFEDIKIGKRLPLFGPEIKRLCKTKKREGFNDFLINSMVLAGEIDLSLVEYFNDVEFSKKVINLALAAPKCKYDNMMLFNYGLDACLKANEVNHTLFRVINRPRKIMKMYEALPIKKPCDLEFKGDELMKISGSNGSFITDIMEEIIFKVVMGELPNDHDVLEMYATQKLQDKDTVKEVNDVPSFAASEEVIEEKLPIEYEEDNHTQYPSSDVFNVSNEITVPSEPERTTVTSTVVNDYDNYKYQALQRELAEVRRMISEKDQKINELQKTTLVSRLKNEVEVLVNQNVASLEGVGFFSSESDKILYKKDQRKIYQTMLLKKPEYAILTKEDLEYEKN